MNNKEVKNFMIINLACIIVFLIISVLIQANLGIIIISLITIMAINILFIINCYKKINSIEKYINDILKGDYSLNINDYCKKDICNLNKEVYELVKKLKEQTELLEKEKIYLEELLENISHQIKTPLNGIKIVNEQIENEKIKKDFLVRNKNQIERIEYMISSLLKLSKLDSGTIRLKQEKIKISSLISKSMEPIKDLIKEKQIAVKLNIRNIDVIVDTAWTSEAILNILKNACEYTKDEILIESNTNSVYTEIKITNNGEPIKKEDIPYIFKRFYNENNDKDSIGIGLNMSKKIIEMQNGIIEVESNDKTTFTIKLYKY